MTEVRILEQVVLVTVHVREHLEDCVTVEANMHSVDHIGEITKGHIPESPKIELLEC